MIERYVILTLYVPQHRLPLIVRMGRSFVGQYRRIDQGMISECEVAAALGHKAHSGACTGTTAVLACGRPQPSEKATRHALHLTARFSLGSDE